MTIGELKQHLEGWEDHVQVVMAKDEEGNNYSPLSSVSIGLYEPESTWSGTFFEQETIGDADYSQPGEGAKTAICLWPVN